MTEPGHGAGERLAKLRRLLPAWVIQRMEGSGRANRADSGDGSETGRRAATTRATLGDAGAEERVGAVERLGAMAHTGPGANIKIAVERRRGVDRRRQSFAAPPPRTAATPEPWLTPGRLLALVAVLVGTYAALIVVRALRNLLVMLLLSLFLSFAMEPAVQYLAQRGWRRGAATGAVFAVALLGSVAVVAAMAPLFISQVNGLVASAPQTVDELLSGLSRLPFIELEAGEDLRREVRDFANEFGDELRSLALGAASNVVSIGATAVGLILQLLAVALVTFYLVADGPKVRRALARPLPPDRQREMLAIWELAVAKTGGYIYSRVLLAVVAGLAHGLFLVVIGVPYPAPLGIWVGITSAFVPVIGAYLGGVLVLIVAALHDPIGAVWVVAFVVLYQQVENYLIAPRLQARTMDVHPALAFVSVLIGGTLLGAVGALLALPATAIIQALLSTYVRRHELIAELIAAPTAPAPPEGTT